MNFPHQKHVGTTAFSLVEVVMALGICSFVLIALLGLFSRGLLANRESEQQIQAANLASMLISVRSSSPATDMTNFAIPSITNGFTYAYGTSPTAYVGLDGQQTNSANAAYLITCSAGTNALTGTNLAQVYLMLSWPPQLSPANANSGRYEINAYIPLQ